MKLLVLTTFFQLALLQTNFSPVTSLEQCDGQRYYNTCGGGGMCQYVQICLGYMTEYRYCPSLDPSKPYCNRGECSETPDFSMEGCSPRVIYCTGPGIFPDPDVCSLYHNCTSAELLSTMLQCPEGEVFDPEALTCKQPTGQEDCMKVRCRVDELFSRYGTSKRFYGHCEMMPNGYSYSDTRIYRCPDGTTFNGRMCSYQCPEVGRFANVANPSAYYECNEQGGEAISMACAPGKVFDASRSVCRTPMA